MPDTTPDTSVQWATISDDLQSCPECGSDKLSGREIAHQSVTIKLDGSGGLADLESGPIFDSAYTHLKCANCSTVFIEDGEITIEDN